MTSFRSRRRRLPNGGACQSHHWPSCPFRYRYPRRDIGLRLVIIIVGDKIFHGIVREKLLKLTVELTGQGLVVGRWLGRLIDLGNDLTHGIGFTRSVAPMRIWAFSPPSILSTRASIAWGWSPDGSYLEDQLECLVFSSINHVLTTRTQLSSDTGPLPSFLSIFLF